MSAGMSRLFQGWAAPSAVLTASLLIVSTAVAQESDAAEQGFSAVQAMQVVDCLLPGQVRTVGGRTYLTPRRPTRTTAADCGARGGEYLAYDRANYQSALNVWLPAAEDGDPGAQTIVGELYERGLGGEPDYATALEWYRRAAEQSYARAQFNLGALYEQGLGVPEDKLEALNWYRRASGLAEDSVIFQSAAAADQAALRTQLAEQIEQRDRQIDALTRQVEALSDQLRNETGAVDDARAELDSLQALLDQLETQRADDRSTLAALPPAPAVAAAPAAGVGSFEQAEQVRYRRRDFGRFYALIIGVQEYELLDDLASPANDIASVADVLENRYGFSVLTLADPDQLSLMRAVNQLNETLEADDNLLIYFVGHGRRLQSGTREIGYWLPRNAEPEPDDTLWVPNEFVTRHLGRIEAQRVLIVSDSCYSGLLGEDPGYVMVGTGSYTDEYIEWKMPKRSRLLLASGVDNPIVAPPEEMHSVFARALLEELENNDQVLTAPELFLRIRQRLQPTGAAGRDGTPQLKAIRDAGHEVGDFFFIPTRG
jgi:uncharacterized protein